MKKIVIKIQMEGEKSRSKAMKVAAGAHGVSSVSVEGEGRDELVVNGEVDAVWLVRMLRKKFCCVTLLTVEQVQNPPQPVDDITDDVDECKPISGGCHTPCRPPPYDSCPPNYLYLQHDQCPPSSYCSIM